MAILPIVVVPDPRLNTRCRELRPEEFGPELRRRMSDMAETMYAAPGVGLAGPQVGDLRRILVADPAHGEDGQQRGARYYAMVNPVILETSTETIRFEEGCLSIPDFWEEIERPRVARVRWQDPEGEFHEETFEDYAAVVIQHEMDHLEGITLLEKVSRFKKSRYLKARRKALARQRREA